MATSVGGAIMDNSKRQFSISLPEQVIEYLDKLCESETRSRSQVIEAMLKTRRKRTGQKKPA